MPEDTRGGFLISQIKQIQERIFNRLLKANGIEDFNGPHGRILYVLWQGDRLPIGELAKRTSLAKTSLTSMLDRMEEKGHIGRIYDKADRRQILIVLTEKAKALNRSYQLVSRQMSEIFYQGFSDEEIRRFDRSLDRVLKNLKAYE